MRRTVPRPLVALMLLVLLGGCTLSTPNLPGAAAPVGSPAPVASVAIAAVPAPTLDGELVADQLGLRVGYPAGWAQRVVSNTLTLAPSQAALERTSPGDELVLTIDATPLTAVGAQFGADATRDPEAFFEVSSGAAQASGYTLSATRSITVDGRLGLAADLGAPGGAGRLTVLLSADNAVRVLGQAAPEAWGTQAPLYDAVLASLRFFAPAALPSATPANAAEQPVVIDQGPNGFVLRIGGSAGPRGGRFVSARGLAAAPDGTLYLAESSRGVWVFAPDGELIRSFGADDLLDAYDVARAPSGDLFVADYGRNAVARFRADGSFVARWGSTGDGPDQFGLSSPQRLALGPDGSVYALDTRPGPESGRVASSVVRFDVKGTLLERIELPADLAPADVAVGEDGAIYLAETFGGAVVKLAPDGSELARFGDPASPQSLAAGAIDLDRQGNIYVATYASGVVKLAPNGTVLARGGATAAPGNAPPAGEFSLPNGIAAAPGGVVWVSDNSGEYSAVSALRLEADPSAAAAATAAAAAAASAATTVPLPPEDQLVRQWAATANASSFYAPDYDPAGATGAPNVSACQDSPDAWASADPNGLETLELRYLKPVFAVGLNIHQSYNPGFISKVELLDERGEAKTVYTATPALSAECPGVLELGFEQSLTRVVTVRITVDQRSGANWSEIDAVELVGVP